MRNNLFTKQFQWQVTKESQKCLIFLRFMQMFYFRPRTAWQTCISWTRSSFARQYASMWTKTLSITLWTSCMHCWASAWSPLLTVSLVWVCVRATCGCVWAQVVVWVNDIGKNGYKCTDPDKRTGWRRFLFFFYHKHSWIRWIREEKITPKHIYIKSSKSNLIKWKNNFKSVENTAWSRYSKRWA